MSYNPPLEILQAESRERHTPIICGKVVKRRNRKRKAIPEFPTRPMAPELLERDEMTVYVRNSLALMKIAMIEVEPEDAPPPVQYITMSPQRKQRRHKTFLPDLMAEMIVNAPKIAAVVAPQPPDEPIITPAAKDVTRKMPPTLKKEKLMSYPKQMPVHVPNPAARKITRVPVFEERPQKIQRPPSVYDNHKDSRFPVYNELAQEWLKKSG